MIIQQLQDNLRARAIRATQEGDIKTLRNLRSFAEERGDLPAPLVSTLSAMIGNALTLHYAGSSIRAEYGAEERERWYTEITNLFSAPTYAQAALVGCAAAEVGVDLTINPDPTYKDTLADKPFIFGICQTCY